MPVRSVFSSNPSSVASAADVASDEAMGSTVKVRFGQAAPRTASGRRFCGHVLDALVDEGLRLGGLLVDEVGRLHDPAQERLDDVGVVLEERRRDDEVGGHVLAVRPQVALVDRTLPPPSWTSRVAHGSGTQAPSMSPDLKVSSVCELACGRMDTSPPPWASLLRPCSLSHARSATSWVLPSCGVASFLPLRSAASDVWLDHEVRAAGGRAGDDADGLALRLRERVDGRVRGR